MSLSASLLEPGFVVDAKGHAPESKAPLKVWFGKHITVPNLKKGNYRTINLGDAVATAANEDAISWEDDDSHAAGGLVILSRWSGRSETEPRMRKLLPRWHPFCPAIKM